MRWANIPLFFFFFSPTIVVCFFFVFFLCIEAVHLLVFEFGRKKKFVFSNFLVTARNTRANSQCSFLSRTRAHSPKRVGFRWPCFGYSPASAVNHDDIFLFFFFFVVFFGGRVCQTWRNVTSGWNCVVSFIVHIDFFVFVCTFNLN